MSSTKGGTVAAVSSLKQALSKELVKVEKFRNEKTALSDAFYERCVDMLDQLDKLPIDLGILSSTLIGTVVTKFKKVENEGVSMKAKEIVKKWKDLAKKNGATTSKVSKPQTQASKTRDTHNTVAAVKPNSSTPAEFNSLSTLRRNIAMKLYEVLSITRTDAGNAASVCKDVELALEKFARGDNARYKEKARSICFNLKRNSSLCSRIIDGDVTGDSLMTMSAEELATDEKKAEREKLEKDLQDSRRLDWEQANEDKINDMCGIKGELLSASLFTCGRCKSTKTTSTQKQTRSADEPMTVFVLCLNCGKRWKC